MANATVSRLGQINQSGATDALFLKTFSGEVLKTFSNASKVLGTGIVWKKTLTSGKSAQFPATGVATGAYHTPGNELVGTAMNHAEVVISVDPAALISDSFVAQIDELFNHYETRSIYSGEQGIFLANTLDTHLLIEVLKGAAASATVSGGNGGFTVTANDKLVLTSSNGGTPASNIAEQADAFVTCLLEAKTKLDQRNAPEGPGSRIVFIRPALYNNVVVATQTNGFGLASTFYRGTPADIATGTMKNFLGFDIVSTNNLPYTNVGSTGLYTYHGGNYVKVMGAIAVRNAIGMVALQDITSEMEYDIRRQGTLLLSKYVKGAGVLRPEFCGKLVTSTNDATL